MATKDEIEIIIILQARLSWYNGEHKSCEHEILKGKLDAIVLVQEISIFFTRAHESV